MPIHLNNLFYIININNKFKIHFILFKFNKYKNIIYF